MMILRASGLRAAIWLFVILAAAATPTSATADDDPSIAIAEAESIALDSSPQELEQARQFLREAAKCYEASCNRTPSVPFRPWDSRLVGRLGWASYRLGEYRLAIDVFESMPTRYPSALPVYVHGACISYVRDGTYGMLLGRLADGVDPYPGINEFLPIEYDEVVYYCALGFYHCGAFAVAMSGLRGILEKADKSAFHDRAQELMNQCATAQAELERGTRPPFDPESYWITVLSDKSNAVYAREAATAALTKCRTEASLNALVGALQDESDSVRVVAVFALSSRDDPKAMALIKGMAQDPSPDVRGAVEQVLGR